MVSSRNPGDKGFGWGLADFRQHEAANREAAGLAVRQGRTVVLACQEEAAWARHRGNRIARMQLRVRLAGAW